MAKGKKLARTKDSDGVYSTYYEPFLNPRQTAKTRSQLLANMLERRLYELAMNRFEWTGLPDEIDVRWMEMALQDNALALFYKDTDDGEQPRTGKYLAMRGTGAGNLNMLGNPTEYIAWGNGIYMNRRLSIDECVPIWANYTRIPDGDIIRIHAVRLAELDRTIEINAKNARQNKILQVPQNARLSAAQIMEQLEAGSNAIETVDGFDITSMVGVLDLGIHPDNLLNLSILRARLWGECMMMLGINQNPGQDKKERLVAAEVSGNDDMIAMIRESNLAARQFACDQINRMFKLNVSVDYKTDHVTAELKDANGGNNQEGGE